MEQKSWPSRATASSSRRQGNNHMDISGIQINGRRLQEDLLALARFGEEPGGGLMRQALSDADREARQWFKRRMAEAGLEVREDEAANIIGRLEPAKESRGGPCIATGSHIDTVPHGGRFDGAVGICASLEALRSIRESGLSLPVPLELIVFTDEEGSHYAGTFGSRAMFNLLTDGEIYQSKGGGQPTLAQALERMGKDPKKIGQAVRSSSEFLAFLELHIEQGPVLEKMGVPIGIVEGIVGIHRYLILVEGKPGHAGTVPMKERDDALVKAAQVVLAVNRAAVSVGQDTVGTIGEFRVYPGAFNIIPGRVEMSLDLRSMKEKALLLVKAEIDRVIASVNGIRVQAVAMKSGVFMDSSINDEIEAACRRRGVRFHRMKSGAGHDAMSFPPKGIPTGMIFIPCQEGKSHCPEEAIRFEEAAIGTQILADTILGIAERANKGR